MPQVARLETQVLGAATSALDDEARARYETVGFAECAWVTHVAPSFVFDVF